MSKKIVKKTKKTARRTVKTDANVVEVVKSKPVAPTKIAAKPKAKAEVPGDIPAFLRRTKEGDAKAKAGRKDLPTIAVKAPAKPLSSAEKLKAMLAKATARNAPALVAAAPKGKVVVALRERGPSPGSPLTVAQVKPGMKVRVFGLDVEDRMSHRVFTIQALDKGEKALGPDWFAIDDARQVHVDFLRVA
jgi:hypothetical protein